MDFDSREYRDWLQRAGRERRAQVSDDLDTIRRLPGDPRLVPALVVLVTLVFSLFTVGIDVLYTESPLFLLLAVGLGFLGWSVGVLLVVLHVLFDFISFAVVGAGPPTNPAASTGLRGRIISYLLLFVLVVFVPSIQRTTYDRIARDRSDHRYLPAAVSAAAASLLVFLWTLLTPYLVRPLFSNSAAGAATLTRAIAPLQNWGMVVSLGAGVLAFGIAVTLQRPRARTDDAPSARHVQVPPMVALGVRLLLFFIFIGSLVSGVGDVVLLVGSLLAAELVLRMVGARDPLARRIVGVPRYARFIAAVGVTLVFAWLTIRWLYVAMFRAGLFEFVSPFFRLVVGLAIGLFVFRVLMDLDRYTDVPSRTAGAVGSIPYSGLVSLGVMGTVLVAFSQCAAAATHTGYSLCSAIAGLPLETATTLLTIVGWVVLSHQAGAQAAGGPPDDAQPPSGHVPPRTDYISRICGW